MKPLFHIPTGGLGYHELIIRRSASSSPACRLVSRRGVSIPLAVDETQSKRMTADKKKEEDYHVIRPGGSLIIAYQIKHKNVLIIGGGNVAAGRIINVLEADGHITLIAPQKGIIPEVQHRINTGQIHTYKNKTFEPSDLDGVDMCLTAIDDEKESSRIWKLCKERKIPVNVADVPGECDFYFGSVYRDGPLQIMISTNGAAPKLANMIRVLVGERLPRNTGRGCENVGKLRRKLRSLAPGQGESSKRMKWYYIYILFVRL